MLKDKKFTDLDPWKIFSPGRSLPSKFSSFLSKFSPHFSNSTLASAFLYKNLHYASIKTETKDNIEHVVKYNEGKGHINVLS